MTPYRIGALVELDLHGTPVVGTVVDVPRVGWDWADRETYRVAVEDVGEVECLPGELRPA